MDSILHNGTYRTRYLFNGKELDNETLLCYYRARYFEPKITVWYGVDPLHMINESTSPYVFCLSNPIIYVDPFGLTEYSSEELSDPDAWRNFDPDNDNVRLKEFEFQAPPEARRLAEKHWKEQQDKKRPWDVRLGDWMRNTFNSHSEEASAKKFQPIAEGVALLIPGIGIPSDILTITTSKDIYGNETSDTDKVVSVIDLASFGVGKVIKLVKVSGPVSKTTKTIGNTAKWTNKATSAFTVEETIRKGYANE